MQMKERRRTSADGPDNDRADDSKEQKPSRYSSATLLVIEKSGHHQARLWRPRRFMNAFGGPLIR
jgi:hypothetical protein